MASLSPKYRAVAPWDQNGENERCGPGEGSRIQFLKSENRASWCRFNSKPRARAHSRPGKTQTLPPQKPLNYVRPREGNDEGSRSFQSGPEIWGQCPGSPVRSLVTRVPVLTLLHRARFARRSIRLMSLVHRLVVVVVVVAQVVDYSLYPTVCVCLCVSWWYSMKRHVHHHRRSHRAPRGFD